MDPGKAGNIGVKSPTFGLGVEACRVPAAAGNEPFYT